ncbi:MAG: protein translocase subunit SecD [Alcanivorax sp.]
MVQISRWKIFLILIVCLYGFAYSSPNLMGEQIRASMAESMPSWFPNKTVNLGLDLRGGAHLLYQADMDKVFSERVARFDADFSNWMKENNITNKGIEVSQNGVSVTVATAEEADQLKSMIRKNDPRLIVRSDNDGLTVVVSMDDDFIKQVQDTVISQVIEVIRRRVDETGTTEPVIQRQGVDRILIQVPGASSEQVRKLVGKTAKLGFHLMGNQGRPSFRDMNLKFIDEPTRTMNVKKHAEIEGGMLENAQPSFNQSGEPVVSFRLDSEGSRKFCDITRKHVGKPFAIVLDEEIVSAPRINEPICGGSGQISGGFDVKEAKDFAILLRAGALPTDLQVVEERTVGPSLGADSVEAGKKASLIGLAFVLVYMIFSYGLFGIMANVALLVNIALILAILSSLQATLTLPGIAGIVLTVGMAVDANVLIFERIREELAGGRTAISSIDAGYSRAMSTIVDSNLTTLIAALILFSFGTGPIKGFAVTMGIGIVTSFFSAIMVTRLLVVLWLRKVKPKTVPI